MSYKNKALIFFGKILKFFVKSHNFDKNNAKILIVSTTAMGDIISSIPFIEALKGRYPNTKIDILTSKIGMQVLKNNINIDNIYVLYKFNFMTYFTCFFKLKKNKYQVCMVSHASQRFVPILAYTLSSNHFLGLANRVKIPDLFNYNDDTDKKINDGNRRLQLFEKLFGDKIYSNEYKVKIYISQIDEEIAKKVLFKLVENRIFFIIQPGASKKNRTIDVKVLIKISSFIYEKYKVIPIISGIKKEEHLHNEIIDNIPQAVSLINYNLSLHQATYIISKSIFYLGNDTGTMHLANSFNVPIFAFTKHDINPSVYPYNIGINKMFQFTKMIENDYAKYNDIESVIKEIELSIFNK